MYWSFQAYRAILPHKSIFVNTKHVYYITHQASTLVHLPLAFVRNGYVDNGVGKVYLVGKDLYDWSRVARSTTYAYYLLFNPTGVNSSHYGHRCFGFPLRRPTCTAYTSSTNKSQR